MNEIKKILLSVSDYEFDGIAKSIVKKWDDPPTPLQILEVLDMCIAGSLTSSFYIMTLQFIYDYSLKMAGTTHEIVVKEAKWRVP